MSRLPIAYFALLLGLAPDCGAWADTPYEQAVLAALNTVRTDPIGYGHGLQQFRAYYHGTLLQAPGDHRPYQTAEGAAAVDDAISLMATASNAGGIAPSDLLRLAAIDHINEQATGDTGHYSEDGSSPADRVRAHGGGGKVVELIAYGARDPIDVVRQLVIDDGVPSRGHREMLLDPVYRFAGVACGAHAVFKMVCVIVLSHTADGDEEIAPRRVANARDLPKSSGDLLKGFMDSGKVEASPPR